MEQVTKHRWRIAASIYFLVSFLLTLMMHRGGMNPDDIYPANLFLFVILVPMFQLPAVLACPSSRSVIGGAFLSVAGLVLGLWISFCIDSKWSGNAQFAFQKLRLLTFESPFIIVWLLMVPWYCAIGIFVLRVVHPLLKAAQSPSGICHKCECPLTQIPRVPNSNSVRCPECGNEQPNVRETGESQ